MIRIVQKLAVSILTLFIGIFTVFLVNTFYDLEDFRAVTKSDMENAVIVTIAPKPPRFEETGRGCGLGYIQGYRTNDGIELTEGNLGCKKPKRRDKRIIQSNTERIISKIETNENTRYEIYQLKNSHCINAPNLELGLELEEWLKTQE